MTKLWMDDLRVAPKGWTWAKTLGEAIAVMQEQGEQITHASLDHDLGQDPSLDGFKLVLWMAEFEVWPSKGLRVHSSNGAGSLRMVADAEHYGPYGRALGRRMGDWSEVEPFDPVLHGVG